MLRRCRRWAGGRGGLHLAAVGLAAVVACSPGPDAPEGPAAPEAPERPEPAGEITVSGRVSRVLEPHVFEIAGDKRPAGEPVLVVDPQGRRPVLAGQRVQATGTTRAFRREVLEAELGVRFDAVAAAGLEGRSCLVARLVSTSDHPGAPP
ncbi:MAG: hypothetical protein ACRDZ3_06125 [Acidimicrobiia bacterium]